MARPRHGILFDIPVTDLLVEGPQVEPLTLDEVKQQFRFTSASEDALITLWIAAARQQFEHATDRQYIAATRERRLRGIPTSGLIELPRPPLLAVLSVSHVENGATTALVEDTDYVVDRPTGLYAARGVVRAVAGWPSAGELRVQYRAGYGETAGAVPELARAAMLLLVAHFHKFRAAVQETSDSLTPVPLGYAEIVAAFKYSARSQYPAPSTLPEWTL